MPQAYSSPDKMTALSRLSRFGMTFAPLTADRGEALLTSWLAGFRAKNISVAGKGAGITGERSGMWTHMARIVGEVRPRYVFVENSPALLTRGLGVVLGDLAALGYDCRWTVLGASDVGAPHRRDRFWLLAHAKRDKQPRSESCGRTPRRVGREFQPIPWDKDCERALREFRGMDDGLAYGVERTDAIRNGQVPLCAATAFQQLAASFE